MTDPHSGDVADPERLFPRPTRAAWWLTAAWTALLLAFSLLSPLFQAPDEPQHVDRILDTSARAGFEDPPEGAIRPDLTRLSTQWHAGYFPPKYSVDRAPSHPRPSMSDLGAAEPEIGRNQQTQHPPGYYALMATARTAITSMLPDDLWTADREVMLLRLLNVLLMVPVPYICWATARQMGFSEGPAVLAALFPLAIPQLGFVGGSVNNDNLVIPAAALVFLASARALRSRLDKPTAALLAVSTAVALMAKGNAVALIPLVLVVGVAAWRRGPDERRPAVAAVAVGSVGGLFYVRNLVLYGEPFPSNFVHVATRSAPIDLAAFGQAIVSKTSESFWGKFGWLAVPMPAVWSYVLMALLAAVLVFAAVRGLRPHLRTMLLPVGVTVLLYVANAFQGYEASGTFPSQQGRYMFICVVPISLALAAVTSGVVVWARRVLSVIVVLNHVMAVVVLFDFYWPGGLIGGLRSIAAWSPLGTAGAVLLVICWGTVLWAMVALEALSARDRGAPRDREDERVEVAEVARGAPQE